MIKRMNNIELIKKRFIIFNFVFVCILLSCNKYNKYTTDNQIKDYYEYKSSYIINIDSNKVHTYEHGNKIIKNVKNKLIMNRDLKEILKNDKYDVCRVCYAGLRKLNSISSSNVNLIEKYMKLYEFALNDYKMDDFILSILEVAEWYSNNVYTYQGAHKIKKDIDVMSKKANINARAIWEKKRDQFNDVEFVMKATSDEIDKQTGSYINNDAIYDCDLFLDYSKYQIADDCSKFAAAVYYHYLNKVEEGNKKISIDLLYTGSSKFRNMNSELIKLLKKYKFKLYSKVEINKLYQDYLDNKISNKFKLCSGDLIYREPNVENGLIVKPAHVEFFINDNFTIGWGRIDQSPITIKNFDDWDNGFLSNYSKDEQMPYTYIVRFNGD